MEITIRDREGRELFSHSCKDNTIRKTLEEAVRQGKELLGADLRGAYLYKALLTRAFLADADLRGACLSRANLKQANIEGADLRGADTRRTNLIDAHSKNAIFDHTLYTSALLDEAVLANPWTSYYRSEFYLKAMA